jgi:hypothetical protein
VLALLTWIAIGVLSLSSAVGTVRALVRSLDEAGDV